MSWRTRSIDGFSELSKRQKLGNKLKCTQDLRQLVADYKGEVTPCKSAMPYRGYTPAPAAPKYETLEAKPRQNKTGKSRVRVWVRKDTSVTRRVRRDPSLEGCALLEGQEQ